MHLVKLRLENFRSYAHLDLDFPKGSILLSGDIGSGKSSILQAIEFALFGLVSGVSNGASYLRYGSKQATVTLEFFVDGQQVTVQRGLQSKKQSVVQLPGVLSINGSAEKLMPTELRSRILSLLGYPQQSEKQMLYRYTVYTSQEQMKSILLSSAEDRLRLLRLLFDLDKYKRVLENTGTVLTEFRRMHTGFESTLATLETQKSSLGNVLEQLPIAKQKATTLKSELDLVENKLLVLEKQKDERQQGYATLQARHAGLLQKKETLHNAKNNLQHIDASIVQLRQSLPKENVVEVAFNDDNLRVAQQELLVAEKYLQEQQALFVKDQEQRKMAEKSLLDLQNDDSDKKLVDLSEDISKLEDKLKDQDALRKSFDEQNVALRTLDVSVTTLKTNMQHLVAERLEEGICPSCKQQITQDHITHLHAISQSKQEALQKEFDTLQEKRATVQRYVDELQSTLKQFQEFALRLSQMRAQQVQFEQNKERLATRQQRVQELQTRLAQNALVAPNESTVQSKKEAVAALQEKQKEYVKFIEQKKRIAEITVQLQQLEVRKAELFKNVTTIEQELSDLPLLEKQLEDSKVILKEFLQDFSKQKAQVDVLRENFSTASTQLALLLSQEAQSKHLTEQIVVEQSKLQDSRKRMHWLQEPFRDVVQLIERHALVHVHHEFSALFGEWSSLLIDNDQIHARLDMDFNPVIEQDGYDVNYAQLSGGERTSIALAYRMALHKVISDFVGTLQTRSLLILDEPTDGFSSDQLDKVRVVLDRLDYTQLILVSHEPKVRGFVDHVIDVVKDHGQSKLQ